MFIFNLVNLVGHRLMLNDMKRKKDLVLFSCSKENNMLEMIIVLSHSKTGIVDQETVVCKENVLAAW